MVTEKVQTISQRPSSHPHNYSNQTHNKAKHHHLFDISFVNANIDKNTSTKKAEKKVKMERWTERRNRNKHEAARTDRDNNANQKSSGWSLVKLYPQLTNHPNFHQSAPFTSHTPLPQKHTQKKKKLPWTARKLNRTQLDLDAWLPLAWSLINSNLKSILYGSFGSAMSVMGDTRPHLLAISPGRRAETIVNCMEFVIAPRRTPRQNETIRTFKLDVTKS